MTSMTTLFVFPAPLPLSEQVELLKIHSDASLAEIFSSPDFMIVNGDLTENTVDALPIERVRELQVEALQAPLIHSKRILFIAEMQTASQPAQNALLKLLEEPPDHVHVILTTTQLSGVLETIQSRSQVIQLDALTVGKTAEKHDSEDLRFLLEKPLTYTEIFKISEKYKDKAEATAWVHSVATFLHDQLNASPSMELVEHLKRATKARVQLEKNVNTRLVIEQFLFPFAAAAHP